MSRLRLSATAGERSSQPVMSSGGTRKLPRRSRDAAIPGVDCVTESKIKNLPASVKFAWKSGTSAKRAAFVIQSRALLYRLGVSEYQQFVLKGAVLFACWTGAPHRPTRAWTC